MTGSCARNLATWAMGTWFGENGGHGVEKVLVLPCREGCFLRVGATSNYGV